MGKKKRATYGLPVRVDVKDAATGKDLFLTRTEAHRALERAKKERKRIIPIIARSSGYSPRTLQQYSLSHLHALHHHIKESKKLKKRRR